MVIVKLMGGLGNQMFQYALGKSLSARLNVPFKLDLKFLLDRSPRENFVYRDYDLDIFTLHAAFASEAEAAALLVKPGAGLLSRLQHKLKQGVAPSQFFFEPHFHFAPEVFSLPKNCYLEGYWQSPRYFEGVESELRKDFTFRDALCGAANVLAGEITERNSVCVNVRRTDFLNTSFHGVCDMRYFTPAIGIAESKIRDPHFYIFSDDPEWCVRNFRLDSPVTFVGHEYKGRKFADYLQLMSLCRHFIIPNSSFAWWAVWLSPHSDKLVVAPRTWIADPQWDSKDLVPESWIRVAN